MHMGMAAKAMNMQSNIKAASLEESVYHDFLRSNKKLSNYPTDLYTSSVAERTIASVMEQKSLY